MTLKFPSQPEVRLGKPPLSVSTWEQPEASALPSDVEHEMPILLPPINEYAVRVRVHYLGEAKPLFSLDDILIEPSVD